MPLIEQLIKIGRLKTPEIISAFKIIKRRDFVRPEDFAQAEIDAPLSIGYGQTISQPSTVAFMIEKLQPKTGDKILDVGSGSGWTAALLAQIAGGQGRVYGLERIEALKDFAVDNVSKYNFIKNGTVQIFCSDGYCGLPDFSPFDKIIVSAAGDTIPAALLKQLNINGRLIMPLGKRFAPQALTVLDKIGENKFKTIEYPGFIFVPLIKS